VPDLPGIDVSDALARLRGDVKLFRRLLTGVARNHAQYDLQIKSALDDGNLHEARARAHDLKGLAGNLSMRALHAAAGALEAGITVATEAEVPDRAALDACLADVRTALSEVVESIRSVNDAAESRTISSEVTDQARPGPAETSAFAKQLRAAAEIGDIDAAEAVLRAISVGSPNQRKLAELIDAFDLSGMEQLASEMETEALS
jgi:HPt (histidine-containing phosphotransfer) domain-containing protein